MEILSGSVVEEKGFIANKDKAVWLTRLAGAEDADKRVAIEREMVLEGHWSILNELHGREDQTDDAVGAASKKLKVKLTDIDILETQKGKESGLVGGLQQRLLIDHDNPVFGRGTTR
ncbi:MAG: DEIH-box ATPase [Trichoglossum hirsutum]|nr:MAG: DEIH-box ATPase [Trichoglossum hirsutum]